MAHRSPLACPICACERSVEGRYGVRICAGCAIEFRPRQRVPIRHSARSNPDRSRGWIGALVTGGVLVMVAVLAAINSPPSSSTPSAGIRAPAIDVSELALDLELDYGYGGQAHGPFEVEVVIHRLERESGLLRASGLLAISGQAVARPQVHVGFYGPEAELIGAVLADVACKQIESLPCPWGFAGSEPAGTADLRIWATGEHAMGISEMPGARLCLGFDDELDPTTIESNLPELAEVAGELVAKGEQELEVRVGLPPGTSLRSARATLVGYAAASQVELVLPMPSPVGLARRVTLPEHPNRIVRWQLWIDGPLR